MTQIQLQHKFCVEVESKAAVRRAAIECSEGCVLRSQTAVTARACSCHREIEVILSCVGLCLAARVAAIINGIILGSQIGVTARACSCYCEKEVILMCVALCLATRVAAP